MNWQWFPMASSRVSFPGIRSPASCKSIPHWTGPAIALHDGIGPGEPKSIAPQPVLARGLERCGGTDRSRKPQSGETIKPTAEAVGKILEDDTPKGRKTRYIARTPL